MKELKYCKLEIFIPESFFKVLCNKLKELDAGHIGNYSECLSYSEVNSRWKPLEGTNPYIGKVNEVSEKKELKVEVTCNIDNIDEIIKGIKSIHPYEEPVINVIPLYMVGL